MNQELSKNKARTAQEGEQEQGERRRRRMQ
jgi:hypothetical protein